MHIFEMENPKDMSKLINKPHNLIKFIHLLIDNFDQIFFLVIKASVQSYDFALITFWLRYSTQNCMILSRSKRNKTDKTIMNNITTAFDGKNSSNQENINEQRTKSIQNKGWTDYSQCIHKHTIEGEDLSLMKVGFYILYRNNVQPSTRVFVKTIIII